MGLLVDCAHTVLLKHHAFYMQLQQPVITRPLVAPYFFWPSFLSVLMQVVVPEGHMWVQGDNLVLSRDSREYGPVPLALVKGRVVLQVR